MCLIRLEMDGRSERSLLWTTIASHKLHASEYDTIVSINKLANKTIFHGDFFSATWQTKFTTSKSKILRFPRYRHICPRAPGKCACNAVPRFRHSLVTGTLFRCPKNVPVTSIYCIVQFFLGLKSSGSELFIQVRVTCICTDTVVVYNVAGRCIVYIFSIPYYIV